MKLTIERLLAHLEQEIVDWALNEFYLIHGREYGFVQVGFDRLFCSKSPEIIGITVPDDLFNKWGSRYTLLRSRYLTSYMFDIYDF